MDPAKPSTLAALTRLTQICSSAIPYALWGAGVVSFVVGILMYGRSIPLSEDWHMIAPLLGQETNLLTWIWERNNEHRLPIARTIYLALLKLTNGDFRSGMWANLVLIGATCLTMMLFARRLRGGRSSIYDAILPLVLLHLGHWENVVWGWQLQFVVSFVVISCLLMLIVSQDWPYNGSKAVIAAIALVALPVTGVNGLIMTPFLAAWFGVTAWLFRNSGQPRWTTQVLLAGAACSLLLFGIYFIGYERSNPYPSPGPVSSMVTGAKFLGMAFGPAGARRVVWTAFAFATMLLSLATVALLLLQFRASVLQERVRVVGLLLFGVACLALAVGTGHERAGWVPRFGIPDRYALISAPLLCAIYLAWVRYGPPRTQEPLLSATLAVVIVALPLNVRRGLDWRNWYDREMVELERDLAVGVTAEQIVERHTDFLLHWDPEKLATGIQMLGAANKRPWSCVRAQLNHDRPQFTTLGSC